MAKRLVRLEVHGCKADLGLQAIEEIEDSDQDWQQSQQADALRGDHQAKRKANQADSQQQRKTQQLSHHHMGEAKIAINLSKNPVRSMLSSKLVARPAPSAICSVARIHSMH